MLTTATLKKPLLSSVGAQEYFCTISLCPPVDHLSPPLAGDHVQQGLPQVVPDAAVAHHLVPEDDEAQVVDILHVVLLHVHAVLRAGNTGMSLSVANQRFVLVDFFPLRASSTHHVHEDVPDHDHGGLVVVPGLV